MWTSFFGLCDELFQLDEGFHALKVIVCHQSLAIFSHTMAMKLILLFTIMYSVMGDGLNMML